MTWLFILAGALLGALAYRARGTERWKWWGRAACALLVSLPVLTSALDARIAIEGLPPVDLGWTLAGALYGAVAGLSVWLVGLAHGDGLDGSNPWLMARTGLAFVAPTCATLAGLGEWSALWLAGAGLLKAACYLLPRREVPYGKYLWKELAFGACWGAAVGAAL